VLLTRCELGQRLERRKERRLKERRRSKKRRSGGRWHRNGCGRGGGRRRRVGERECNFEREAARKGKAKAVEPEDSEEDKEESETGDVSEDIGKSDEDDGWVGGEAGWYWEYLDIKVQEKVPIKALGEMSHFFPFFEIPSQVVEMQCNFDQELEKANRGRYNLWAFGVLTHLLPVSIPVPTPNYEVFFSEELVRRALPGLEPGNQSLSLAALAVNEGVPVAEAAVEGVSTTQLNKMVTAQRLAAAEGGDGEWPMRQIAPGIYDYTVDEIGARRLVLNHALNKGKRAAHQTGVLKCEAKMRKVVPE
jgi:hypothetical protein